MRGRPARRIDHPPLDPLDELLVLTGYSDQAAFAGLYDRVSDRAYGVALRVLTDPHQAQEVVQEAFFEVWRKAARFDPGQGSATGWVLTITHRRAVDRVRSSSAARRRDSSWHDTGHDTTGADATFDAADANIAAARLRAALRSLTPLQRRAIELAYLGGYTYSDVAVLMAAPLGTTKTRIRTALLRLREHLDISAAETA